MEVQHLAKLLSELTPNSACKYVRSDEVCVFVKIDSSKIRLYTKTPDGNEFEFAPTFIQALAEGIEENKPFNTSQILNNKGSNRAVIDSIIAHTSEFYWLQEGRSRFLVWIPSRPHNPGELIEWTDIHTLRTLPKTTMQKKSVVSTYTTDITSYLPYLTALRTKPFMLLAGISGTGKSRIVRKLAQATNTKKYANEEDRWKDNRPDNFQLIQVKPNWHNSMDVAGFLSNIPTPHYVFTDFVRFIVKAWQHPETPYFLCLDEMNLAPVEEYFAEFLSAIESRAWDENGHYTTDPIISPFKDFGKDVCEAMLKELLGEARHTEANPLAIQFTEKGLTLPPNLMVMGTVNMDETTFSFSRKVLDRAMSVEMNEVKYDDFLEGKTELMPLLTEWNEKLVNRPQKAQEVQGEIDSQKVIDYLKAVNELLDSTPFKLGYRAANEAILYVAASQEFAQGTFSLGKALDEFTLMKILSRIEGDDSRLAIDENDERLQKAGLSESPLDNGEQNLTLLNGLRAIVRQHIGTETETEKKINHMYTTLCREHFVSYWA